MPTEDSKHYYCDEGTDEDPTPVHRCNQNATTNHPTPVILDDAALAEIEKRPSVKTDQWCLHRVLITESERDALCATVRAAWAVGAEWESSNAILRDEREELRRENTALCEQLAQAHDERWHTSRLLTDTQARLAEVEQERSELLDAMNVARAEK